MLDPEVGFLATMSAPVVQYAKLGAKRYEEREKVAALDRGADDYVTKPFAFAELLARVRRRLAASTLTRAVPSEGPDWLAVDGLEPVVEAIGLAAPQVTYIIEELRARGAAIEGTITTVEEAKNAILAFLGRQENV